MPADGTSQSLVRVGFPLFWVAIGVVQWFWPAAVFPAFSNDTVTPGARAFAVLWLCVGVGLGMVFIPLLHPFDGWAFPGFVLCIVGALQWVHPVWQAPLVDASERALAAALLGVGAVLVGLGL